MSDYLIAIDPGSEESAILLWNGDAISSAMILPNEKLISLLLKSTNLIGGRVCAIEMVAHYGSGMPAGQTIFDTVLWIGRFDQAVKSVGGLPRLVYRKDVKLHLCGKTNAKDPNVTQALKDRFGDKGTKAAPGVTYGLKSHLWQALAVAVFAWDTR